MGRFNEEDSIKLFLRGNHIWIDESNIVELDDKAIQFYHRKYPKVDVVDRLELLGQLQAFNIRFRPLTKEQLHMMICDWLAKDNITESMVASMCGDNYCSRLELKEFFKNLGGKE